MQGKTLNRIIDDERYEPSGWWWTLLMKFLENCIGTLLRVWTSTWKMRVYGIENVKTARESGGVMLGAWHGQLLMCAALHRDIGFSAIVSPVWEGEIISRVLTRFGFKLIRASQRKNRISGFKGGIKLLRDNKVLAMALDGPEGPAKKIKKGNITQAAMGKAAFLPSAYVCKKAIQLPTWDNQRIPLPFAEVVVKYGEVLTFPKMLRNQELDLAILEAEKSMQKCEKEALKILGY